MDLLNPTGGLVSVGDRHVERLLKRGYKRVVEEAPETVEDDWNHHTQGEDTSEPVQDAPALPEPPEEVKPVAATRPDVATVRAWAKENDIEVSAKGRVSGDVYEKYAEAHKESE